MHGFSSSLAALDVDLGRIRSLKNNSAGLSSGVGALEDSNAAIMLEVQHTLDHEACYLQTSRSMRVFAQLEGIPMGEHGSTLVFAEEFCGSSGSRWCF